MRRLTIVAASKLREPHWRAAAEVYERRLRRYVRLDVVEIREVPVPGTVSDSQRRQVQAEEARRILAHSPGGRTVALDQRGEMVTSEGFARALEKAALQGETDWIFWIGGPFGLDEALLERAHWRLSLSPMTFTSALARVVLLEQLYRAFTLIRGEPYHK